MDNRRIVLAVMAGCVWAVPENAIAFVVEDLVVQQTPDKPFHAEIRLRMSADEQFKDAKIGSSEDFRVMRLTRSKNLDSITLDTAIKAREARISLTSDRPILQKDLDLVLQITSSKQTQFPVFHLKPELSLKSAKNIQTTERPTTMVAQAETPQEVTPQAVVEESPPAQSPAPVAAVASSPSLITTSMQQYGPIKEGDNLTNIARRLRKEKGVSIFQIMTALFERNADHFHLGNMNSLISGGMLNVPSFEEIRSISDRQARIFCMEHTKVWEQVLAGKKVPPPAQSSFLPPVTASASVEAPAAVEVVSAAAEESSAPVLTPSHTLSTPPPQVSVGLEKMLGQLQNQLGELTQVLKNNQTQQVKLDTRVANLETAQSNNEALASRVSALEKALKERPVKTLEESPSVQDPGTRPFGMVAIGLVASGLLFALSMLWLGLRWNRQAQWSNLKQFLVQTAREHPFLVQDALKQTEPPVNNDYVPSINTGKMDGVPLQTGKKVVNRDPLQNVHRWNAMEQERGETG